MRTEYLLPEIEGTVWKGETGAKKKKLEQGRHNKHACKVPDSVVLDIRRLHEIDNVPMYKIFRRYPNLRVDYIRCILAYVLRANLRVK